MSIYLEITQLENGDIVLREADEETDQTEAGQVVLDAGQPDRLETDQAEENEVSGSAGQPIARHGTTARSREPLVRISFSAEVRDMLGGDLVGVAEAMIDAATDYLGGETIELDGEELEREAPPAPVIH